MKAEALTGTARVSPSANSMAARLVRRLLGRIRQGQLVLVDGDDSFICGDPQSTERCAVFFKDPRAYRQIVAGGDLGAAEAYMDGHWTTDDLTLLVRLLLRNRSVLDEMQASPLRRWGHKLLHSLNRDSVAGSKRNIHAHYDLGNAFFRAFLDPTMTYSSGFFHSRDDSLEQASINKIDRLCKKLQLKPQHSLVEIGTGWGTLAIHAATRYGCKVTTTTISEEQYQHTRERVRDLGLQDRITVLKQDYRLLQGKFDKLVSVEMIEAVGLAYLPEFFRKCAALLKPDGQMALQAITIADQHFERARRSVDFIQRYIFPGGALPSVTELTSVATRHTDLRSLDLQDITAHYAETLRRWRRRFNDNLDEIRALGFSNRFLRMWDYYLAYCEGGFMERAIGCIQIQFHKPAFRTGIE